MNLKNCINFSWSLNSFSSGILRLQFAIVTGFNKLGNPLDMSAQQVAYLQRAPLLLFVALLFSSHFDFHFQAASYLGLVNLRTRRYFLISGNLRRCVYREPAALGEGPGVVPHSSRHSQHRKETRT
jgi:hypothetical protein